MRKTIANAMLCLLLLLSVATARCESLCMVSSMPSSSPSMQMQHEDAMVMDSGMEHCHGMMHNDMPNADAGCGQMNCRHQALPASSDFRIVADDTVSLAAVSLPIVEHVVLPLQRVDDTANPPRIVPLTPLEQTSMLRV